MLNYSQSLDAEIRAKGVHVQAVLPGATRTEIFDRAGIDINKYDASQIMDAGELVDAALAGLDAGEFVTIPPLPDDAQWHAFEAARLAMGPNLSLDRAAKRYGKAVSVAACMCLAGQ